MIPGVAVEPLVPGSDEWRRHMTASKVPAVLGLSPYKSRFHLFYEMRGEIGPEEQTDEMSRGHYLEPAIAAWWQDTHHEGQALHSGGCWRHAEHDWMFASPDRCIGTKTRTEQLIGDQLVSRHIVEPSALLEIKTDADHDYEWGEDGSDEVPPFVRAQCVWQMDCVGVDTCHIAVLKPYLDMRAYTIRYDADEAAFIRSECRKFMDDIANNVRPDIDGDTSTYEAIRELHPDIDGTDVQVDDDLARRFLNARIDKKLAEEACQLVTSELADVMGDAQRALWGDAVLARRQTRKNGTPYLVAAKTHPLIETENAA